MDRILLPHLKGDVQLRDAFREMARTGARAVIVTPPSGDPILFTNQEIDGAVAAGLTRVGEMGSGVGRPLHQGDYAAHEWEQRLDEAGRSFGLAASAGDVVVLVTRHEGLAEGIRHAHPICRCEKNWHTASSPGVCGVCGSTVDCA